MPRIIFIVFIVAAVNIACDRNIDPLLVPSDNVETGSEPGFLITKGGDSILTGAPIPVHGKRIHPDSVAKPRPRPLQSPPKVVKTHANIHPAGKPEVVQIPGELTVVTPGDKGVSLPDTVPARGKVVPALQPPSVPAGRPIFKDGAVTDLQYLGGDQGMKPVSVSAILEDSRGDLWFGTSDDLGTGGGGASRYDGSYFTHFTTEEGLIDNNVLSIVEDRQGNLWFGTAGGLTCYDGVRFTNFTAGEGLSDENIQCILEDRRGDLWFGTLDGGVNRYNGAYFIHYTKEEGLTDDRIRAMTEDEQGNLWFGTGNGLTRYDGVSFTHFTTKEGLSVNHVRSLSNDRSGRLWIGTRLGGVNLYDPVNGTFTIYTEKEGLSYDWVSSIQEDDRGNMWFATTGGGGGVSRFDPDSGENGTFTHYKKAEGLNINRVQSMLKDSRGHLWFGALYPGGVNRYSGVPLAHYSSREGLSYDLVTPILEDSQGNLWIGALGGGVNRFDADRTSFTHYAMNQGLHDNRVVSLMEDSQGNLWFGASAGGVNRFDPVKNELTHYGEGEGLIGGSIRTMLEDSHDRLWFGTQTGLSSFNPAKNEIIHYSTKEGLTDNSIGYILEDSRKHLWFGTCGGGVSRYVYPDTSDLVRGIDRDGTFTHFTTNEGLSDNDVRYILEDSRGYLWFGTSGGGLNRYNPSEIKRDDRGRFIHYTTKEGLISNVIHAIIEDDQKNIWVSTDKGISRLVPIPGESSEAGDSGPVAYRVYNYGKEDGFKWINFTTQSACLDHSNRIWWGSYGGLTMLDPGQLEVPSSIPKPRLNTVEIGETFVDYRQLRDTGYRQSLPFGKKLNGTFDSVAAFYNYPINLQLPHQLKHLTFQFSAIDWDAPQKIKYRYRMKGLEEQWSPPTSHHEADYRNLPPGEYTFQVQAAGPASASGGWSEPFEYTFQILLPWWLTWWAYLIYALWVILFLYLLYRFLLNRQLEHAEIKRLQELNAYKTRLYTNITHEFRTPLAIILGMARQIKDDPKKWYGEGLEMITRNGRQLLNLVNQMLDLSKLDKGKLKLNMQQGEIVGFIHYLVQSFETLAAAGNIQLHFLKEVDRLAMDFDPDQLTKVVSNLLSNAIKYTPEGGQVYVTVRMPGNQNPETLELRVKDTGIGIPPKDLPHIFDRFYQADSSATRKSGGTGIGLTLTKELVQLMGGEIQAQSEVGEGSDFSVSLPIARSALHLAPGPGIVEFPDLDAVGMINNTGRQDDWSNTIKKAGVPKEKDRPVVLLIEDNRDVLAYLAFCLEADYLLEFAANGREGIEQALEIVPDIIISDIMMPEQDGYEVCVTLKADIRTSHIPIILLTAKVDRDSKLEGLKSGADAYLPKPFDKEELKIRLAKLLELRQQLQDRYGNFEVAPEVEKASMSIEDLFLHDLRMTIEDNLSDEGFGIAQLCRKIGMSRSQLHNKLKALTGQSASHYIRAVRLERAKDLLRQTDLNISEVAYKVGFRTPIYFTQAFTETVGVAPSIFKNEVF
jgi:signal transduction histidine kinase/ligand-binding sensor domain-containing protein/DNA-binding response OmpR family regulator